MIKAVIIEDEAPAAKKLRSLLEKLAADITVLAVLDSIEESVKWFEAFPQPDLVFMDMQLADGLSVEIFRQTKVTAPVIFTTAYDQYMLTAFRNNGIEYLLKPLDEQELQQAIEKFRQFFRTPVNDGWEQKIGALLQQLQAPTHKERFLVKNGQQFYYVNTAEMACMYADGKLVYALDFYGKRHLLEGNLSALEQQLPPKDFYRVSRHLVVHVKSVRRIHPWFSGRLKLELEPVPAVDLEVSRDRVSGFKEWLGK
ncbi:LytR/AlgR family response regulator transcription factor [Chitinophaga niabensis]|uniref:DNA-binding response regulator, LytR/AlgR family n=1 Tax=Chitinophaga niabensis TaxID=536979 RepID=A0A1N6JD89_9BACT|nr:LytTR family DNA-binding domain-containing protein [Chitinophaga niabensis]SIO42076.1 DNA-binding response regulator, LytR/AlgR family [Chitinophaga niabensis]